MNDKVDATLATIAALMVLFTTMIDPSLSAALAVVLLVAFAVVKLASSRAKGGQAILPPEGFIVEDKEGPLRAGELERAAGWGRQIAGHS